MRLFMLWAQVTMNPDGGGIPGGSLIQKLLDWGGQIALWGSLGSVIAGAAVYGLSKEMGAYQNASKGKTLALGGAVGAILCGLAATLVNLLFNAARGS
ncbi:MAG TPA: hypothetical protein VMZ73_08305 [Acidimicrobiales bacterium]|nr:hypothetical protein [Acidimicrobiales bacterium]